MKKKFLILLLCILLVGGIILFIVSKNISDKKREEKRVETQIEEKIKDIKSYYNTYAKTNKETNLFKLDNNEYIEFGMVNENVNLTLEDSDIDENTKYFHIKDLDLYVLYSDVSKIDEYTKSDRYKNYIYFNENIKTNNETVFYDFNDNYMYKINDSFDFKVLVEDDNRYGVVYNDELLFVHSDDVENIYVNDNNYSNKNRIKVLTYHLIYNPEVRECGEAICQSLDQLESHLKYIRDNDYFTLKLDELEMYLDGKINIPQKSIVITIDDGTVFDLGAIGLLEKYRVNATLFVITSWVNTDSFKSEYLDLESHTDNMHNQYECPGYGNQGGGILCLPEEQVLLDLHTSQEKLGGSKYFAYPFFDFNDRAIRLLKEAGFHMAFIGQYDTDGYSFPKVTDKFKVRRTTIFSDTTVDDLIYYLQ